MKNAVSDAWFIATVALCVVLLASIVNNVGTAVQSQDNCRDIQQINDRLRDVFAQTEADLKSGSRDADLQDIYGSDLVKQQDGSSIPHWLAIKKQTIKEYERLEMQFKHEPCPFPLFGINHRR